MKKKTSKKVASKKKVSKKVESEEPEVIAEVIEVAERRFSARVQISLSKNIVIAKYASKPGDVKEIWRGTEMSMSGSGFSTREEAEGMLPVFTEAVRKEINTYFDDDASEDKDNSTPEE